MRQTEAINTTELNGPEADGLSFLDESRYLGRGPRGYKVRAKSPFGRDLQDARISRNLTIAEVGKATGLGSRYQSLERGDMKPFSKEVIKLMAVLDFDVYARSAKHGVSIRKYFEQDDLLA